MVARTGRGLKGAPRRLRKLAGCVECPAPAQALAGVSVEEFFSDRAVDVLIVVGLAQGAGFGFFPGAALYAGWSLWLGFPASRQGAEAGSQLNSLIDRPTKVGWFALRKPRPTIPIHSSNQLSANPAAIGL